MSRLHAFLAALLTLAALADSAAAETVMYSAEAAQTDAGQRYEFHFDTLPPAEGSGWLTITARGDYTWSGERVHWNVDHHDCGIAGPSWGGTVLETFGDNDVLWQQHIEISAERMARITEDGDATIWLHQTRYVNVIGEHSWIKATLKYETHNIVTIQQDESPVPEPAAFALLALGTGALLLRLKRKRGPTR